MSNSIFNSKTLHFIGVCILSATFIGCNNDSEILEEQFDNHSVYITKQEQTLQDFANKHAKILYDILNQSSIFNGRTRASNEDNLNMLYDEIEDNIKHLSQEIDLYADIPDMQNKPCMNEDSVMMMQMDYDMFLSYTKKNKSPEFYNIYKKAIDKGYFNITADDVISNKKLFLNEKYVLLLALPVADQATLFQSKLLKTSREASGGDKCLDAFYDDRRSCGISYGIACGLSCARGVAIWGLGVFVATVELNNCLDRARDTYINCQKLQSRG